MKMILRKRFFREDTKVIEGYHLIWHCILPLSFLSSQQQQQRQGTFRENLYLSKKKERIVVSLLFPIYIVVSFFFFIILLFLLLLLLVFLRSFAFFFSRICSTLHNVREREKKISLHTHIHSN